MLYDEKGNKLNKFGKAKHWDDFKRYFLETDLHTECQYWINEHLAKKRGIDSASRVGHQIYAIINDKKSELLTNKSYSEYKSLFGMTVHHLLASDDRHWLVERKNENGTSFKRYSQLSGPPRIV